MAMFIPDYSDIDKMLVPDGYQHLNDLNLARHAKSSALAELYSKDIAKTSDAPAIIDYSQLTDEQLFDCCVDKDLQTLEEFQGNYKEFRL